MPRLSTGTRPPCAEQLRGPESELALDDPKSCLPYTSNADEASPTDGWIGAAEALIYDIAGTRHSPAVPTEAPRSLDSDSSRHHRDRRPDRYGVLDQSAAAGAMETALLGTESLLFSTHRLGGTADQPSQPTRIATRPSRLTS